MLDDHHDHNGYDDHDDYDDRDDHDNHNIAPLSSFFNVSANLDCTYFHDKIIVVIIIM